MTGPRPNFLVIGATKSGTTSLHRYFMQHPDVFMHPQKEMRFFTAEHRLSNGVDWYVDQFKGAEGYKVIGESSNAYARAPVYAGAPERIHAFAPNMKLIYLTRDPLRRLESHYRHRLVTGIEWCTADQAVEEDTGYIAASLFGDQLEAYLEFFPKSQIRLVAAERLFADPQTALGSLCSFLNVPAGPVEAYAAKNVTSERRIAPSAIRGLSRFPRARNGARRASELWNRTPFRNVTKRADEPEFCLSPETRASLTKRFAADQEKLLTLTDKNDLLSIYSLDADTSPHLSAQSAEKHQCRN